jgi:condensin complex subunit 1
MRSKIASDVLESIDFLCVADRFGIDGSKQAISKSLPLVWSEDERLRNAVMSAYVGTYLTNNAHSKKKDYASQVVKNLLNILHTSTLGELASLEKLVSLFVTEGHIPDAAIKELWKIYKHIPGGFRSWESVLSCQLLSMVSCASGASVSASLEKMMSIDLLELNGMFFLFLWLRDTARLENF